MPVTTRRMARLRQAANDNTTNKPVDGSTTNKPIDDGTTNKVTNDSTTTCNELVCLLGVFGFY